jgi:hypothetical protein
MMIRKLVIESRPPSLGLPTGCQWLQVNCPVLSGYPLSSSLFSNLPSFVSVTGVAADGDVSLVCRCVCNAAAAFRIHALIALQRDSDSDSVCHRTHACFVQANVRYDKVTALSRPSLPTARSSLFHAAGLRPSRARCSSPARRWSPLCSASSGTKVTPHGRPITAPPPTHRQRPSCSSLPQHTHRYVGPATSRYY